MNDGNSSAVDGLEDQDQTLEGRDQKTTVEDAPHRRSIIIGKPYPIILSEDMITTLQYSFKPSNFDLSAPGKLSLPEDTASAATLSYNLNDKEQIIFTGNFESRPDSLMYVLHFDPTKDEFKMTKVAHSVQHLKPVRDEQFYSKDVVAKVSNSLQKATDVESFRKRQRAEKIKSLTARKKSRTVDNQNNSKDEGNPAAK